MGFGHLDLWSLLQASKRSKATFGRVPAVVLAKIFEFVSVEVVRCELVLVCRFWRQTVPLVTELNNAVVLGCCLDTDQNCNWRQFRPRILTAEFDVSPSTSFRLRQILCASSTSWNFFRKRICTCFYQLVPYRVWRVCAFTSVTTSTTTTTRFPFLSFPKVCER